MIRLGKILLACIEMFPPTVRDRLYDYCKKYTERCEGINNEDMATNGELEVVRKHIPSCGVVFDVGAHVGEWTELVLKYNPQAQVHCFESSAPAFKKLLSRNFPPNVVCNHFGLSSHSGEAALQIFGEGSGMNTLYRRQGLQDRDFPIQENRETILLKTLDGYCEEKISARSIS